MVQRMGVPESPVLGSIQDRAGHPMGINVGNMSTGFDADLKMPLRSLLILNFSDGSLPINAAGYPVQNFSWGLSFFF